MVYPVSEVRDVLRALLSEEDFGNLDQETTNRCLNPTLSDARLLSTLEGAPGSLAPRARFRLLVFFRWLLDHTTPIAVLSPASAKSGVDLRTLLGAARSAIRDEELASPLREYVEGLVLDLRDLDALTDDDIDVRARSAKTFDPVPRSIVEQASKIANRTFSFDSLDPRDVRRSWRDRDGEPHVDRLFEDVVLTLFTSYFRVGDQSLALGYHRHGEYADGKVLFAGERACVLYDAKSSKKPVQLRDHESQIQKHLRLEWEQRPVSHYLLVGPGFTPKSVEHAKNSNLVSPSGHETQVGLWHIDALLHLGLRFAPSESPEDVIGYPREELFRTLLQDTEVTVEKAQSLLDGSQRTG